MNNYFYFHIICFIIVYVLRVIHCYPRYFNPLILTYTKFYEDLNEQLLSLDLIFQYRSRKLYSKRTNITIRLPELVDVSYSRSVFNKSIFIQSLFLAPIRVLIEVASVSILIFRDLVLLKNAEDGLLELSKYYEEFNRELKSILSDEDAVLSKILDMHLLANPGSSIARDNYEKLEYFFALHLKAK